MAFDTKKYIIDLVKQLNLRHMDEPRRAQLKAWQKDGRATGKQKKWDPDAELPDVNDRKYGGYAVNELESVLRWLSETAAAFAADDDLRSENKEVDNFIKKFYTGTEPVIPIFEIGEIAGAKEIADYIESNASELEVLFEQEEGLRQRDLEKLYAALRGNYRTNVKAQQTLNKFLYRMEWNTRYETERIPTLNFPKAWLTGVWDNEDANEINEYLQQNKPWIVSVTGGNASILDVVSAERPHDVLAFLEELLKTKPLAEWPTDKIPNAWKSQSDPNKIDEAQFNGYIEKLNAAQNGAQIDVSRINNARSALDYRNRQFTNEELEDFEGNIDKVFEEIITNDKLREAVVARGGDVAKWVSKGMDESNYKDGTDKVPPKIADKKRLFGRATNAVSGYYNNTWGKLFDKHKRHVYSTDARFVVEALFKANIKPTDGLGKVMEKLDDIANSQPGPVAKQIKWMKETLEPMSKTTQFKEALTHGGQMQKVVSDVIAAAAHDGSDDAMQAARMTLETLAMMQSTMVTSGVREELHKMDFTIFSDPSMSFNKGAMGIVTKALDKTLRFATLAAYEVGNFVANAIKKTGGKIKKDKIKEAAGKAVSDEDMRRIELQVFWNFINSNANTDLNVLKRHFKKQNAADEKAKDEHGNDMAEFKFEINGEVRSRKDPTVKEVEFLNYMIKHGYAKAA